MSMTQAEVHRKIRQHDQDLHDIYDMLGSIDATLRRHEKRFTRLERRLDSHDERFDAIDERLDGLGGRLDGLEGKVDGLAGKVDQILELLSSR